MHVGFGLIITPIVLAELWSVAPKLFAWPPAHLPAQLLERLSLLMLVGAILFEIATGLLNFEYDYIVGFSFCTAHYYRARVFIAGFVVHVGIKLRHMIRNLRTRSLRKELRTSRADTVPEEADAGGLVATDPARPTISRRGALGLVGGGSDLAVLTFGYWKRGQSGDAWMRAEAILTVPADHRRPAPADQMGPASQRNLRTNSCWRCRGSAR